MLAENPLIELRRRVERYYTKYLLKRLWLSTLVAVAFTGATAGFVYLQTESLFFSGAAVLVVGWVLHSWLIAAYVPSEEYFNRSKRFLGGAIQSPARIRTANGTRIVIEDEAGDPRRLKSFERRIWNTAVLPYILEERTRVEAQRETLSARTRSEDARPSSSRDDIDKWERKMQEQRNLLKSERERLERRIKELQQVEEGTGSSETALERLGIGTSAQAATEEREQLEERFRQLEEASQELEERTKYVNYVEDSLVERLNELTRREAELEQKEINSGLIREDR